MDPLTGAYPQSKGRQSANSPPLYDSHQDEWSLELASMQALEEEVLNFFLERKMALRKNEPVDALDKQLAFKLGVMKERILQLEQRLSHEEETQARNEPELRNIERALLDFSKQHDRLEQTVNGTQQLPLAQQLKQVQRKTSADMQRSELLYNASEALNPATRYAINSAASGSRYTNVPDNEDNSSLEMQNGELVVLQRRMMEDQDTQLDQLSETLARQKQIGLLINEELSLHIDMLQETEDRVQNTENRLRSAGRRLQRISESTSASSKGVTIICILVMLLVLIIAIARKF